MVDGAKPIATLERRRRPSFRPEDIVLWPKDVRVFISNGFTAYQESARSGVNLRLPILIYVAAQFAPTVDEQFVLLFSCLEKVVHMLDQKYAWDVLKPNELRTIGKSLRSQLRDIGKDAEIVGVVSEKITELARPAFWRRRLSKHLKRLKVDLGINIRRRRRAARYHQYSQFVDLRSRGGPHCTDRAGAETPPDSC